MGAGGHPGKKREVEDSSKKLGALFWRMNKGEPGARMSLALPGPAPEALPCFRPPMPLLWCAFGIPNQLRESASSTSLPVLADPLPPLGTLVSRPAGEVSQSVASKLLQLCQALDGGDFVTATHLQVLLEGRL